MNIKPGTYTIDEILRKGDFDFRKEAAADYLNGEPDYRRVKVGGVGFDDLDEKLVVPPTADNVTITLDDDEHTVLGLDLSDEEHQKAREYSFETAAEATQE